MTEHVILYCTCPDEDSATDIANNLVTHRLAACVNIIRGITSTYLWQGAIETSNEHLLLIKTRRDRYPQLEEHIRSQHPYELPEIIMVPIEAGLRPYLAWIDEATTEKNDNERF